MKKNQYLDDVLGEELKSSVELAREKRIEELESKNLALEQRLSDASKPTIQPAKKPDEYKPKLEDVKVIAEKLKSLRRLTNGEYFTKKELTDRGVNLRLLEGIEHKNDKYSRNEVMLKVLGIRDELDVIPPHMLQDPYDEYIKSFSTNPDTNPVEQVSVVKKQSLSKTKSLDDVVKKEKIIVSEDYYKNTIYGGMIAGGFIGAIGGLAIGNYYFLNVHKESFVYGVGVLVMMLVGAGIGAIFGAGIGEKKGDDEIDEPGLEDEGKKHYKDLKEVLDKCSINTFFLPEHSELFYFTKEKMKELIIEGELMPLRKVPVIVDGRLVYPTETSYFHVGDLLRERIDDNERVIGLLEEESMNDDDLTLEWLREQGFSENFIKEYYGDDAKDGDLTKENMIESLRKLNKIKKEYEKKFSSYDPQAVLPIDLRWNDLGEFVSKEEAKLFYFENGELDETIVRKKGKCKYNKEDVIRERIFRNTRIIDYVMAYFDAGFDGDISLNDISLVADFNPLEREFVEANYRNRGKYVFSDDSLKLVSIKKKELSALFREQNTYLEQLLKRRKLKHPEVDVELYGDKYGTI